jgi:hypothetical protein
MCLRVILDTQRWYKALEKMRDIWDQNLLPPPGNKDFAFITDAIDRLVDMITPLAEFAILLKINR